MGEAFPVATYVPSPGVEAYYRKERRKTISDTQYDPSRYQTDRSVAEVAVVLGLPIDLLRQCIYGRKIADICAGRSSFGLESEAFDAADVVIFDADEDYLALNPISPSKKVLWNVASYDMPGQYVGVFDVTVSTYGLPFWHKSIKEARQSIKNQAAMTNPTAGIFMNGPAVSTNLGLLDVSWNDLNDWQKQIIAVDYAVLEEIYALESQGFTVGFKERKYMKVDDWSHHSVIAYTGDQPQFFGQLEQLDS